MSVDIIQPFSSRQFKKRARETISLASDGSSKCAEIFVTNNADKWTFFCAFCQKATCDIGAFICHIRLEHLNVQPDLGENHRTSQLKTSAYSFPNDKNLILPMTSINTVVDKDPQEPIQRNIIKEEVVAASNEGNLQFICSKVSKIADIALSDQPESIEADNLLANKNSVATTNRSNETQDQFFEISEFETQHESITNNDFANVNDLNTRSCYSLSDDETYFKNNAYNRASGSKPHKRRRKQIPDVADSGLLHYKCPTCNRGFQTKQAAIQHILYSHDENFHKKLPIKCRVCHRGFHTASGLKAHTKSHDLKKQLQCPVCPSKHIESYFITHVLMHESETCFPCQVCGKVYDSHDERMRHWETHAKEKPFDCKICYRRYRKQQYLTRHLKIHNQYQCNFCPAEFVSTEAQRAPYVCASCEKLPDIMKKAEHLRIMAFKNHVFDSDEDEVPAQHNEESIDNKQILLFSNTNNETRDEPYNDSTTQCSFSLNEAMENDDDNDELSNEDDSDLEFVDETYDVDNTDDHDDDVPSGSGHNISQLEEDSTFKCSYCDRVFTSRQALAPHLKCHINNDHVEFRFKCSYCNRGFQTKSGLTFHHKTHDKNKYQFKCPICPFSGYREGDFINHVLTHENKSCFPCQVCAKILPTNEERVSHWKTHVHEKPHGCKFCYRRFSLKHILNRHIKTHIEYTE